MPLIPSPSDYFDPVAIGPTAVTAPALAPPGTVGAGATWTSALTYADGFTIVALAATLAAAGSLSIQRYLDAAGTIAQGPPVSVALASGVANQLISNDGLPFQSFTASVTNSSGAAAALSFYSLLSAQELRRGNLNLPTLDLNYAARGSAFGIETFTRASTAWDFDRTGTLVAFANGVGRFGIADVAAFDPSVRHNLVQWSDDATKWNASNGGGGTATTATQITWSGAGGMGLKLDGAGGAYALEPNTTYTVNATVQLVTGSPTLSFRLYSDTAVFQESAQQTITTSAVLYQATFTTPATVNPAGCSIQLQWQTNATWNVSQLSLRKGTLPSFAVGGYQQTVGVYAPAAQLTDTSVPHNLVRRSKPTGGAPGVVAGGTITGTMPTDWAVIFNPDALLVTFNGVGTDSDGDYAEFNIAGNAGANSGGIQISAHGVTAAIQAAPIAQGAGGSARYGIKYLTTTGAQGFRASINETTAAGAYNGAGSSASSFSPSASLQFSSVSRISTATNSACQESFINLFSGLNQTGVNYTFRIYQPQLNLGGLGPYVATSGAIVPPVFPCLGYRSEDGKTNSNRNSSATGAVPGTPGTMPTGWTVNLADTGLAPQVVGSGTEDGIPYVDLRFSGTALGSTTNGNQIIIGATTDTAAANAQAWTVSTFLRLVGGTLANVSLVRNALSQRDGAGAFLADLAGLPLSPTGAPLKTQRRADTLTTNQATIGFVEHKVFFTTAAGAVDFTLRVGAPQLELGAFASTPILTTSAAVARATDSNAISGANLPAALQGAPAGLTMMVAGRSAPAQNPAGASNYLQMDDSTTNNRVYIRREVGRSFNGGTVAAGVAQTAIALNSNFPDNTDFRAWYAVAANDEAGAVNGGNVATSGVFTMAAGFNRLTIGGFNTGSTDSTIKHVAIYAKRAPTATAIGLCAQL